MSALRANPRILAEFRRVQKTLLIQILPRKLFSEDFPILLP